MNKIIHWLESHMLSCPFKETFGIDCPGCGIQRSFILLLKGDLIESFCQYPPLIPMIFLNIFLIIHLIFKIKNGGRILLVNFIVVAVLMVANFIYKLIR